MIRTEKRYFDLPAAILLVLAVWLVGLRIQVTNWADNLSLVQYSLMLSTLIGMAVGLSVFKRKALVWVMVAYSLLALAWLFSLLMPADMVWAEKVLTLSRNIRLSLLEFFRNQPVQGADLFMAFMIFAFWWIGLFAGFRLVREGKPWLPVGILFAAFLIVDYYPPFVKSRHIFGGFMVFFLLLLLGRMYYLKAHDEWREKRTMVDYGAGLDFARYFVTVSLLLVTIAWGVPGLVQLLTPGSEQQQKFVDLWRPLQDRLANVVTDLRGPRAVSFDFYGNQMVLGTQISEDETALFTVKVSNPRARGFRYYWRGVSYDFYSEGEWSNTLDKYETIRESDWPLDLPDWKARQKVDLTVNWLYNRSRLLYIPGSPLEVSRPVQWVVDNTDTGLDGIVLYAQTTVYKDESYDATAWVSVPTGVQLQEAGENYPGWVRDRYLQLPDDLPESIGELAAELTAGLDTPLDKVLAVTNYLRSSIEYSGKVNPPEGRDPLEWFLFESQSGFCNYYASAEVVMLRTLGIPARLVVGFVQGDRLETNLYEVKLKHSHAWPEVYFPGLGWVEFEPTVIQTPAELVFDNPSEIETNPLDGGGLDDRDLYLMQLERFENMLDEGVYDEVAFLPKVFHPWREWGIFLATMVLIAFVFWLQVFQGSDIFDRRLPVMLLNIFEKRGWETPAWLRFLSIRASMTPIGRLFSEIPWMLKLLGRDVQAGQTPAEQVDMLLEALPEANEQAGLLLNEFQLFTYSPRQGDLERARLAHSQLWNQVLVAAVRRKLQR